MQDTAPPRNRPPALIDQLRQTVPSIPVTWLLVATNLLVFVAMLVNGAGLWHSPNSVQLAWGASFGPATKDGQWWRLGSSLFLHFGLLHLAMNMLALWDAGRLVERLLGPARFALLYFSAGLAGNLLSLISQGDMAVAGGASGAVFGVYGGLLVGLWQRRSSLHPAEFRWLFWGAAGFSVLSGALGLLVPGIDNAAHIGGFVSGLLAALALMPATPRDSSWRLGRLIAGGVLMALLAGLATHIPAPRYRWSEEQQARGEINRFVDEDARIAASWSALLGQARAGQSSFEELAGRVDTEITSHYEQTFERLSAQQLSPAAPSAPALAMLKNYAVERRDASQQLAEGLRAHDLDQIKQALRRVQQAEQVASQRARASTPAQSPSPPKP